MAPVIVIGGGLAGLCCARRLHAAGVPVQLLEAAEAVGGRVRTDRLDGFLLDRGFQVLLTAYPEAQRELDYRALDLRPFVPGALVRVDGAFHRVVDPWRRPLDAALNALAPVGSLADKARVALLRRRILSGDLDEVWTRPERRTRDLLVDEGFSAEMIERFFRPFFGGVLFDPELDTSSRMFEFTFRMFALGDSAVPAAGMGAIPAQLAASLPPDVVRTGVRVVGLDGEHVQTSTGERLTARALVVATEGSGAAALLRQPTPPTPRSCTCVYFAAEKPPIDEAILLLDGQRSGPVNNVAVMSNVAPSYAPPGAALVAATLIGTIAEPGEVMVSLVRQQMTAWFGQDVARWRHLRSYRIPYAQPDQKPGAGSPAAREVRVRPGLYVCGDHRENGSINGAMRAGIRAADACLADLG